MYLFEYSANVKGIAARQNPDGSFSGDEEGEVDTRFSYCAVSALKLLSALDQIDVSSALQFVHSCRNFDGGYGAVPGAESHAGQGTHKYPLQVIQLKPPVFCSVGMLSILGAQIPDADKLGEWLAWRQLACGGLNGRPEKLEDVCYSWWVVSSIAMLGRLDWISKDALQTFIIECQVPSYPPLETRQLQDPTLGGFSDRPDDMTDIFHTLFGIAGLSLLGYPGLAKVDPLFCMPTHFTKSLA